VSEFDDDDIDENGESDEDDGFDEIEKYEPPEEEDQTCVKCGAKALRGVTSDIGPLCKRHTFGHMDVPVDEPEEQMACSECGRIVRGRRDACSLRGAMWHEECLRAALKRIGKCPKCGMEERSCGCWNGMSGATDRMVEQAKKDAASIFKAGDKNKLCHLCLAFNTATAMGLPLHSRDPRPGTETCSQCFKPICDEHVGHPPEKNILGLDPASIYCSGGWVDSCYKNLEKSVACSFEHCETNSSSYRGGKNYDPLVDHKKCEKCDAFWCNEVAGHEQCPNCEGYRCDRCRGVFQKDDLHAFEEDAYTFLNLCEGCLSEQENEENEAAWGNWLGSDYRRALEHRFSAEGLNMDLSDVDTDVLKELFDDTASQTGIYWSGTHIEWQSVAQSTPVSAILGLPGATIDGMSAGSPLPRKAVKALERVEALTADGYNDARRMGDEVEKRTTQRTQERAARLKRSTRASRASKREGVRKAMSDPERSLWRESESERERLKKVIKKLPRTLKGMRAFLDIAHPVESRRKHPEFYGDRIESVVKERRNNPDERMRDIERKFLNNEVTAEALAMEYLRGGMDREAATKALRNLRVTVTDDDGNQSVIAPIGVMDSHEAVAAASGVPLERWRLVSYGVTGDEDTGWDINDAHYTGDVVMLPGDVTRPEIIEIMEDERLLKPSIVEIDEEGSSESLVMFKRKDNGRPVGSIERGDA
jgi:hypothetical protein